MNYEFVQVSFAPNLTADGIMRKVKQFAKSEEHKDCDMSVVVISSHGDEGIIEVFFYCNFKTNTHITSLAVPNLPSISSIFYTRIFCTKVRSMPNSK
jgi:hypothetical protein